MPDDVVYPYTDENGSLLFEVVRKPNKKFQQRRPTSDGGYVYNLSGIRRVLYRLPDVIEAVKADRPVWVTEGEKDADALVGLGLAATCNPGGAGVWPAEFSECLREAYVVLVRDMDDPGLAHVKHVAGSLKGIARRIEVVEPAHGKDAFDHVAAGGGPAEFIPIELEPPLFADVGAILRGERPRTVPTILEREDGKALLYPGKTHAIQSEPGLGKTFIALAACAQQMSEGKGAIYLDWEGDIHIALDRLLSIGVDGEVLTELFFYANPPKLSGSYAERLVDAVGALDISIAVLDGVARSLAAQGLSENKADEYLQWAELLPKPLSSAGAAVLMLDHVVKDKDGQSRWARGTGAKLGEVDVSYSLKGVAAFSRNKEGRVAIKLAKDRLGCVGSVGDEIAVMHVKQADEQSITLEIRGPEFTREPDGPAPILGQVRAVLASAEAPGMSQNTVEMLVSARRESVRWALEQLIDTGEVRRKRVGRGWVHQLVEPLSAEAF